MSYLPVRGRLLGDGFGKLMHGFLIDFEEAELDYVSD